MERDRVVLEDQPFNLRKCVEESLDQGIPNTIISDPGRPRQVLGNLLSNAVKFTDKGEFSVSVSSQQIGEIETNEIHFAMQDTGIGIPQCSMHQLFQPFSQMEPSTTRLRGFGKDAGEVW